MPAFCKSVKQVSGGWFDTVEERPPHFRRFALISCQLCQSSGGCVPSWQEGIPYQFAAPSLPIQTHPLGKLGKYGEKELAYAAYTQ
jgi:hypothetical protein